MANLQAILPVPRQAQALSFPLQLFSFSSSITLNEKPVMSHIDASYRPFVTITSGVAANASSPTTTTATQTDSKVTELRVYRNRSNSAMVSTKNLLNNNINHNDSSNPVTVSRVTFEHLSSLAQQDQQRAIDQGGKAIEKGQELLVVRYRGLRAAIRYVSGDGMVIRMQLQFCNEQGFNKMMEVVRDYALPAVEVTPKVPTNQPVAGPQRVVGSIVQLPALAAQRDLVQTTVTGQTDNVQLATFTAPPPTGTTPYVLSQVQVHNSQENAESQPLTNQDNCSPGANSTVTPFPHRSLPSLQSSVLQYDQSLSKPQPMFTSQHSQQHIQLPCHRPYPTQVGSTATRHQVFEYVPSSQPQVSSEYVPTTENRHDQLHGDSMNDPSRTYQAPAAASHPTLQRTATFAGFESQHLAQSLALPRPASETQIVMPAKRALPFPVPKLKKASSAEGFADTYGESDHDVDDENEQAHNGPKNKKATNHIRSAATQPRLRRPRFRDACAQTENAADKVDTATQTDRNTTISKEAVHASPTRVSQPVGPGTDTIEEHDADGDVEMNDLQGQQDRMDDMQISENVEHTFRRAVVCLIAGFGPAGSRRQTRADSAAIDTWKDDMMELLADNRFVIECERLA